MKTKTDLTGEHGSIKVRKTRPRPVVSQEKKSASDEAKQQTRPLQDAVYRIAEAAEVTRSLEELYPRIHQIISSVMPAENFYITLYDETENLLRFPYFKDEADVPFMGVIQPQKEQTAIVGKGLTAYVLRTGKSLLCTQAVHDDLERRGEIKLLGVPSAIWLGVPLMVEGKTIGVMVVQHYTNPKAYGEREQHMLEFVSTQVAIAINRKRAEEKLEEERILLRTLIDNLPDRIYVMDVQGRKIMSNIADWEATGAKKMEDVIGKTDHDIYPPELAKQYWSLNKSVIDSGISIINREEPGRDEEGKPVWFLSSKVPLNDWQGKTIGLVSISRDITERKQTQMLQEAVYHIAAAAEMTHSLEELYPRIHEIISSVMPAENFFITVYDEAEDLLRFPYFKDEADLPFMGGIQPGKGLSAYVLRTGKSLLCTQAVHDDLERRGEIKLLGVPSAIWLGVPLTVEGKTIGAMVVQHYTDPKAYGEREQHMLEFVSTQVAIAINRKRVEEKLDEERILLRTLIDNLPDRIYVMDVEGRKIMSNHADWRASGGKKMEDVIGKTGLDNFPDALAAAYRMLNQSVIESGISILNREEPGYDSRGKPVWFTSSRVPLTDRQGKIVGLVGIDHDITSRKQMEEEIRNLTLTDDLTGLYNRRGFTLLAEQEIKLAQRNQRAASLFFVDVDQLKLINDTWGHAQGDAALQETSSILNETFRDADIIARLGGDEFVIFAPDLSVENATILTNRVQAGLQVREHQEHRPYHLSLSVGIAHFDPTSPSTVNELIVQADEAMYKHKQRKKDTGIVSSGDH